MAHDAMAKAFMTVLEQVKESNSLRSLLISDGREDERPHIKIENEDYVLGLIDDQPMLLRTRDGIFVNPEIASHSIEEFVWRLKPKQEPVEQEEEDDEEEVPPPPKPKTRARTTTTRRSHR